MKKLLSALALFAAIATTPLRAQQRPETPAYDKDPGTAMLIGALVTGGGQIYAGETAKGLGLLGGAIASVGVGTALTLSSVEVNCDDDIYCEDETNYAPLVVGYLAALGLWGYGIVDAPKSVERMRARSQSASLPVVPTMSVSRDGSTHVGMSFSF